MLAEGFIPQFQLTCHRVLKKSNHRKATMKLILALSVLVASWSLNLVSTSELTHSTIGNFSKSILIKVR